MSEMFIDRHDMGEKVNEVFDKLIVNGFFKNVFITGSTLSILYLTVHTSSTCEVVQGIFV